MCYYHMLLVMTLKVSLDLIVTEVFLKCSLQLENKSAWTRVFTSTNKHVSTCRVGLLLFDKLKLIPLVLGSDPLLSQHPGDIERHTQFSSTLTNCPVPHTQNLFSTQYCFLLHKNYETERISQFQVKKHVYLTYVSTLCHDMASQAGG